MKSLILIQYSEVCLNLMREDRGGGHHPHPTPGKFILFINIVKLPKIGFVNPPPPGKHNHLLDPPLSGKESTHDSLHSKVICGYR